MASASAPRNDHLSILRQKGTSLGPHCLFSDVPFASIESVLVTSYVHLEFSNRALPPKLSENFTLPTVLAFFSSRMITALVLTTGSSCMGLSVDSTQIPNSLARQLAQDAAGSPIPYVIVPGP